MVIAAIGTVLAAGYLLWMYQRVAMGTPKPEFEHEHIHDVHGPEWIAWTPLLLGIVVFGLFPNLIFSITDGAADTSHQGVRVTAMASVTPHLDYHALAPEIVLTAVVAHRARGRPRLARERPSASCRRSPGSACSSR